METVSRTLATANKTAASDVVDHESTLTSKLDQSSASQSGTLRSDLRSYARQPVDGPGAHAIPRPTSEYGEEPGAATDPRFHIVDSASAVTGTTELDRMLAEYRVYRRAEGRESLYSTDESTVMQSWSVLSEMSISAISSLSFLALPIAGSEMAHIRGEDPTIGATDVVAEYMSPTGLSEPGSDEISTPALDLFEQALDQAERGLVREGLSRLEKERASPARRGVFGVSKPIPNFRKLRETVTFHSADNSRTVAPARVDYSHPRSFNTRSRIDSVWMAQYPASSSPGS